MAAVWAYFERALLLQRGHLFGWAPLCMGAGIAIYFALRFEPTAGLYAALAGLVIGLLALSRFLGHAVAPLAVGAALVALGVCLAGARAHLVDAPVLGWRYYGPVEGRVVGIDRSSSDAVRVTLDRVRLRDVPPDRTPDRVRLSLHSKITGAVPAPGLILGATAHLSPPSGPVEPGGFDFRRHAWFQGLGAVGYTRVPLVALAPADQAQPMFRIRMALSSHVQAMLPGEAGAFAAAIMTGDRSGMGQDTLTALRVSNLAHLLAISGLHMGLLTAFVFAAFRYGLALVPWLALRAPVKPVAAALALVVAAFYLALSGGSIATERAFIMVAVMLVAVMLSRRALSLRAVALAALIVLCLRPEALLGPGFQMSFSATTALIAVFGWLQKSKLPFGPKWLRPVTGVIVSSLVAGLATAPFAAAHFNQFAHYGLIANLLSVPLMGALVMPAAVLSVCLLPIGLEGVGLWVMGVGLDWILGVARWTAALDGARGTVVNPSNRVLPLLTLGALMIILWQGRLRLLGLAPMIASLVLWIQAERPSVLIADTGGVVGIMTDQGRALSAGRGDGFTALNWLENDGDAADQETAARRWSADLIGPGGITITAVRGKRAAERVTRCVSGEWVIFNTPPPESMTQEEGCIVISPKTLFLSGAIAIYENQSGGSASPSIVTAHDVTGRRLWNTR
ncbi:ComEC/Rec2 family competence protein [Roseovarius dicentrarchi]|uniref:ComEC/Rec2 family competence protein n=1 Tax=Roseovarius dicentrarchi TaxID=2250573 RepID=UPI001EEF97C1|nr:ComEC/Rec2 family competence protein [Roseovarius dicentrarchi]